MTLNLSKQTFRQWLASPEFRRGVAVQVASGLIITAIVTIIGLGIHSLRSDPEAAPAAAVVQPASPAPPPARAPEPRPAPVQQVEPTPANDTPTPADERAELFTEAFAHSLLRTATWGLGVVFVLMLLSGVARAAFGIR